MLVGKASRVVSKLVCDYGAGDGNRATSEAWEARNKNLTTLELAALSDCSFGRSRKTPGKMRMAAGLLGQLPSRRSWLLDGVVEPTIQALLPSVRHPTKTAMCGSLFEAPRVISSAQNSSGSRLRRTVFQPAKYPRPPTPFGMPLGPVRPRFARSLRRARSSLASER